MKSRRFKKKVEEEKDEEQTDEEKGYRTQAWNTSLEHKLRIVEEPRVVEDRKEREPVNI